MTTIDQVIAEKLSSWYVGEWPLGNLMLCIIAMFLAVVLCGAIGIEREKKGRSAGLRTHLLVGVGSCLIMIVSIYGFPKIIHEDTLFTRDVARLAAGVITGVGFLGAGAIIHRNSGTKGLTTAATIWLVMAIGLACGSMNFVLAIFGTVLILVVLTVFKKFEYKINKSAPLITVNAKEGTPLVGIVLALASKYDCKIDEVQIESLDDGVVEMTFLTISKESFRTVDFVSSLEKEEGVIHVGVLNRK